MSNAASIGYRVVHNALLHVCLQFRLRPPFLPRTRHLNFLSRTWFSTMAFAWTIYLATSRIGMYTLPNRPIICEQPHHHIELDGEPRRVGSRIQLYKKVRQQMCLSRTRACVLSPCASWWEHVELKGLSENEKREVKGLPENEKTNTILYIYGILKI